MNSEGYRLENILRDDLAQEYLLFHCWKSEHEILGSEYKKGRQEGRQEGRKEGELTILRRQIEKRFGALPKVGGRAAWEALG